MRRAISKRNPAVRSHDTRRIAIAPCELLRSTPLKIRIRIGDEEQIHQWA